MKREEAAKYFRSKLIQLQWEEEMQRDRELLDLAGNIPREEIEQDFQVLLQAVKQQCAISLVNKELIKEGMPTVPDVELPDSFPSHNTRRKSEYISFSSYDYPDSTRKFLKQLNFINSTSMPNISANDKPDGARPFTDVNSSSGVLTGNANKSRRNSSEDLKTSYIRDNPSEIPPIIYSTRFEANVFTCSSTSNLSDKNNSRKAILFDEVQSLNGLNAATQFSLTMKRYENELCFNGSLSKNSKDSNVFQAESSL